MSFRSLFALLSISIAANSISAEEPKVPMPTETIIKMELHPQAAPIPVLKYSLLPEVKEINPGNVVQNYLKCFMEQNNFFYGKESNEQQEKWLLAPLKDLPDLKDYGGSALRQADYAARLDNCDWQILAKLKSDGIGTLLPDVQMMRKIALALKVRYRGEIKDRRFEDALRTHKTMFAMARHMQENPAIIPELVGIAIATQVFDPLQELLQQPGAPNLYWAFAQLPKPFIDIRKGMECERFLFGIELAELIDTLEPLSETKLELLREKFQWIESLAGAFRKGAPDMRKWLKERAKEEKVVKAATARLLKLGIPADKIKKWPALQIVMRDEYHQFEAVRDDYLKWILFPYPEAVDGFTRAEANMKLLGETKVEANDPDASILVNAVLNITKIYYSQLRLQQRLAMLQHIEAIRIYAAANDAKFPATLAAIGLPLPVDPFTGQAFIYKLEGETAILQGLPPKGMEKTAAFNVRYELKLKK